MWNPFFEKQHKSPVITDAKSVYVALERSESSKRNVAERRTAIEVTPIRQRLEHGFIYTSWVNSDGQMADGLRRLGSCWGSCLQGDGKLYGMQLFQSGTVIWQKRF